MSRKIRITYLYQHRKDLDYQKQTFTLDEIELGDAKEYTRAMKMDGYALMDRCVSTKRKGEAK